MTWIAGWASWSQSLLLFLHFEKEGWLEILLADTLISHTWRFFLYMNPRHVEKRIKISVLIMQCRLSSLKIVKQNSYSKAILQEYHGFHLMTMMFKAKDSKYNLFSCTSGSKLLLSLAVCKIIYTPWGVIHPSFEVLQAQPTESQCTVKYKIN